MALPGWMFVVVGAIVSGVSWWMVNRGEKMSLFLVVGIGMLVFGLIKLYIDRPSSRDQERAALERELPGNKPRDYSLSTIPRVCSMCSAKNNPRANYCGHCGSRL